MQLYKGITYWGKKGGEYLKALFQILPAGKISHIVEVCVINGLICP